MTAYYSHLKKILLLILSLTLFIGCDFYMDKLVDFPTMPLIHIDFEEEIVNQGIFSVNIHGKDNVSYSEGVEGKALDLSLNAQYRKPVLINYAEGLNWEGYPGLTMLVWVKLIPDDPNEYTIVAQMTVHDDFGEMGWKIENSSCGTWKWTISDGANSFVYQPTKVRQPINDGEWHLIGFSLNYADEEARLYYDGLNVAVYSLEDFDFAAFSGGVTLGGDPFSTNPISEVLNGYLDDFIVWSRVLTTPQVESVFGAKKKRTFRQISRKPDSLTVMSWNIWSGGKRLGKFVGIQRVAEMIKESGADLVSLQEAGESAPIIADMIDFYLYQRGDGLSVLSRYPLGKTYNVYHSNIAGAVTVELPKNNQVILSPVSLSYLPNQEPYILSGQADPDTVLVREMKTRGAEMRYIAWELQSLLKQKDKVPVIVAGELNAGSHLDWTERNKKNRYGLVLNFPTSRVIEEAGFTDAYREIYPNEVSHPGYTWSPLFKKVLHDRLSYIFYNSASILPSSSQVIDKHPIFFPSDHAAVVVSFKWK